MWLDKIPQTTRRVLLFVLDFASIVLALYLAFFLRFEGDIPPEEASVMRNLFLIQIPLRMLFFYWYGMYRGMTRYASIEDLMAIFRAVSLSSLTTVAVNILVHGFSGFPRSVLVIDWTLVIILVGGLRFLVRALVAMPPQNKGTKRVLIIGAGDTGESLLREILFKASGFLVVGLVDDNPRKQGLHIHGVPVLGDSRRLAELVAKHHVEEIFIAMPSASAATLRKIVSQCQAVKVRFRRVPAVKELLDGRVTISHLREVQLEDLLGREPVTLDNANLSNFLQDRIVLVTGAGGSIGSELCRQIAHYRPRLLLMLDQAENGLYYLDQDFLRKKIPVARELVIADVTDRRRLQEVFSKHRPHFVFHAAAHKHVPLMEMNRKEAVKNNVFGTRALAETAQCFGVEKFVMISTDKAVNPTSTMGVTKRLAEMLLQSMSGKNGTAFIAVRFGNVLGSDGSVVPLFKKQLVEGGPLTITHPEIERYFMTIPEAVQLVLQAGAMGTGGEIFVLDMGKPVKIVDLARNLISLAGHKPEDVEIRFVGLRPGEKLYEELWREEEKVQPTVHAKIMAAQTTSVPQDLNQALEKLEKAVYANGEDNIIDHLRQLVPNYRPAENGSTLRNDRQPSQPLETNLAA